MKQTGIVITEFEKGTVEYKRAYHNAYRKLNRDRRNEQGRASAKRCGPRKRKYTKEQNRVNNFRNSYKLKVHEYDAMLAAQNGVCAVCGNKETIKSSHGDYIKRLAVDHCHTTGKIRGLLCQYCNMGLGALKEDINIMYKMIEYVKEHTR